MVRYTHEYYPSYFHIFFFFFRITPLFSLYLNTFFFNSFHSLAFLWLARDGRARFEPAHLDSGQPRVCAYILYVQDLPFGRAFEYGFPRDVLITALNQGLSLKSSSQSQRTIMWNTDCWGTKRQPSSISDTGIQMYRKC